MYPPPSKSERLLPHDRPVHVPFIVRRPVLFEDAGLQPIRCAVAGGHSLPCWRCRRCSCSCSSHAARLINLDSGVDNTHKHSNGTYNSTITTIVPVIALLVLFQCLINLDSGVDNPHKHKARQEAQRARDEKKAEGHDEHVAHVHHLCIYIYIYIHTYIYKGFRVYKKSWRAR